MPKLNGEIKDFVAGDNIDITKTITNVPVGQTITKAWFTVKTSKTLADANAVFQKTITAANQAGVGVILDDGAADQIAKVFFELTNSNTSLLAENVIYHYDIQVLTSAGKIYTPEVGVMKLKGEATKSTA